MRTKIFNNLYILEHIYNKNYFNSGRDYNEERRNRLREIEVKIMQYQDELESGRRTLKSGMTIQAQVEHYRKKLIRKVQFLHILISIRNNNIVYTYTSKLL